MITQNNNLMRFNNCDYRGLAHEWAYNHKQDLRTGCSRMHTRGNTCYSYSTAIAYKIIDRRVLLIARERFSNTTYKQKCILENAFSHWNIIEISSDNIPKQDGFLDSCIEREVQECFNTMQDLLENCKKNKQGILAKAKDRETFCRRLATLRKLMVYLPYHISDNTFKKYEECSEYCEKLREYNNARIERSRQAYTKRAKKDVEERIKRNKLLQTALENYNHSGSSSYKLYSFIIDKYSIDITERKQLIENFFDLDSMWDYREFYSYIWRVGVAVKTTQSVIVPWKDVELLLKLWKAGKPILGKTVGQYIVLAVNDKYVQVGCHKIPVVNLNAIYEEEIKCVELNAI